MAFPRLSLEDNNHCPKSPGKLSNFSSSVVLGCLFKRSKSVAHYQRQPKNGLDFRLVCYQVLS